MFKFKILKDINIDLKGFDKSKAKEVKASDKVYEVDMKLAKKQDLLNRFSQYPDHIEIIVEQENKSDDLGSMKKDELVAFAKENDIEIDESMKKDELKEVISNAIDNKE